MGNVVNRKYFRARNDQPNYGWHPEVDTMSKIEKFLVLMCFHQFVSLSVLLISSKRSSCRMCSHARPTLTKFRWAFSNLCNLLFEQVGFRYALASRYIACYHVIMAWATKNLTNLPRSNKNYMKALCYRLRV